VFTVHSTASTGKRGRDGGDRVGATVGEHVRLTGATGGGAGGARPRGLFVDRQVYVCLGVPKISMRRTRRNLMLGCAGLLTTGLAGYAVSARPGSGAEPTDGAASVETGSSVVPHGEAPETSDGDVEYARNAEEVKGHLTSSAALLARGRTEDAALHAGHATDYFAALLTPLRDANHDLATRLRGQLKEPGERVRSMGAESYRQYLTGEVFPMVDRAVETVVSADARSTTAFDVRVSNTLAGRIAGEYSAAVDASGTIQLEGEYWDARGFLNRIEARHGSVASSLGGAGGDALGTLRSRMEAVEPPSAVRESTLRFRVATAAAADLPAAHVEDRSDALSYVRNLEEVHGHLVASAALVEAGDESAAALHAGHGGDYVTTLVPAVVRADADLGDRFLNRLLAAERRLAESPGSYGQYVSNQVAPVLEEVSAAVVPDQFRDSTAFGAAVIVALAGRLGEEYDAAVTEDEVIELYGEYWDARGFLNRIEARFGAIRGDLEAEVRDEVAEELGIIRTELETAATPADVAGSVEALEGFLSETAAAS
jgi:hypothetical protein